MKTRRKEISKRQTKIIRKDKFLKLLAYIIETICNKQ